MNGSAFHFIQNIEQCTALEAPIAAPIFFLIYHSRQICRSRLVSNLFLIQHMPSVSSFVLQHSLAGGVEKFMAVSFYKVCQKLERKRFVKGMIFDESK